MLNTQLATAAVLPIAAYHEQILALVRAHQAVIITAETGAGKSTQVPSWLADAGYAVTCTQPRRLAARTLAQRVAEERDERLGETIGVRTREDRAVSSLTRCVYATDGLALVRELVGDYAPCLVLDEVHEWSLNVETLVAWARRRIGSDPAFRVVLMSATMDAQRLSEYFDGAPVVSVPGRLHPIEDVSPQGSLIDDTARLLVAGRNVLVFQPGRAEIERTAADLHARGVNAELIPLHGSLAPTEQARAFAKYQRPKCVIATNVAQTSVTIDDIDAVVDSGMERRSEVVRGIEGLYLRAISRADALQRRGRAGRTRPGVYVDHCPAPDGERAEFPTAEILRSRLDQTVLRLAVAGLDAGELEFFHQPRREDIAAAKLSLTALGFLGADGVVTDRGRRASSLPVAPHIGAMVLEAERLGCVSDVLTVAALLESGSITARGSEWRWRRLCAGETSSDLLAQAAMYRAAARMRPSELQGAGIHVRALHAARDTRRALAEALGRSQLHGGGRESACREDILRAICAGLIAHVYRREGGAFITAGDAFARELDRESVVSESSTLVVGVPWDLEVPRRGGGTATRRLLRMVTAVAPALLAEIAPHLCETRTGLRPAYDQARGLVVSTTETRIAGVLLSSDQIDDPNHPEARAIFSDWLDGALRGGCDHPAIHHARRVMDAARVLNQRADRGAVPWAARLGELARHIGAPRNLDEAAASLLALQIDPEIVAQVEHDTPARIVIAGHELSLEYTYTGPRSQVTDRIALDLPDEIRIPDGRLVAVEMDDIWCGHDLPELRRRVREASERELHDRHEATAAVAIDVSVFAADEQPEIEERAIGVSPLDGRTVYSYGVVELVWDHTRMTWWRSREDAQRKHEWTRAAWTDRREEARDRAAQVREEWGVPAKIEVVPAPASASVEALQARFNRRR